MSQSDSSSIHDLLGGRRCGAGTDVLRAALAAAEPFYAAATAARNWLYDRGALHSHRLPRPVISVGNITTGGTGKTPVVRWLAAQLRDAGMHPAILMRGYKRSGGVSDEEDLLRESLGGERPVIVHADPNRIAGAAAVLRDHPETDIFILDDGFQHRRVRRQFELILIDATNPFGFCRLLPRGLLREPVGGLRRADAFILTRSDQVEDADRAQLEETLRAINHMAPVYRARHVLAGVRSAGTSAAHSPDLPIDTLATTPFFAAAGIANPAALHRQLSNFGKMYRGHLWFNDHQDYTEADVAGIRQRAADVGAEMIIVTEKDWRKLRRLPSVASDRPPIRRLDLEIHFGPPGESGLLDLIQIALERP